MAAERVVAAAMRIAASDLCMVGGWVGGWMGRNLDGWIVDWQMGWIGGWAESGWGGTGVVWVEDIRGYPKSTFRVSGMSHYCAPNR